MKTLWQKYKESQDPMMVDDELSRQQPAQPEFNFDDVPTVGDDGSELYTPTHNHQMERTLGELETVIMTVQQDHPQIAQRLRQCLGELQRYYRLGNQGKSGK